MKKQADFKKQLIDSMMTQKSVKTDEFDIEKVLTERFGEKYNKHKSDYAPRKLSVIVVEDKLALLRPVGAEEVSIFTMMTASSEMGVAKACEYLITELWLDGDDEILSDEEYFISAMMQVQSAIELKKSSFYRV